MTDKLEEKYYEIQARLAGYDALVERFNDAVKTIQNTTIRLETFITSFDSKTDNLEKDIHRSGIIVDDMKKSQEELRLNLESLKSNLFSDAKVIKDIISDIKDLETRQRELDRWKWMILGAGVIVGALLGGVKNLFDIFSSVSGG